MVLKKKLGVKRKVMLCGNYVDYYVYFCVGIWCLFLVVKGRQGGRVWEFIRGDDGRL